MFARFQNRDGGPATRDLRWRVGRSELVCAGEVRSASKRRGRASNPCSCTCSKLFDHLVGAGEQHWRCGGAAALSVLRYRRMPQNRFTEFGCPCFDVQRRSVGEQAATGTMRRLTGRSSLVSGVVLMNKNPAAHRCTTGFRGHPFRPRPGVRRLASPAWGMPSNASVLVKEKAPTGGAE
jgi:hypothetical protein